MCFLSSRYWGDTSSRALHHTHDTAEVTRSLRQRMVRPGTDFRGCLLRAQSCMTDAPRDAHAALAAKALVRRAL